MGCGSSTPINIKANQPADTRQVQIIQEEDANGNTDKMMCAPEILRAAQVRDEGQKHFDPEQTPGPDQPDGKDNEKAEPKGKKKLTPDEIKEKILASLDRLRTSSDYTSEESLADLYYLNKRFSSITRGEDRSINMLAVNKGIVDLCLKVWKYYYEKSDFLDPKDTLTWTAMKRVLVILWNGSDRYTEICERLLELQAHKYCLEIVQDTKITDNCGEELSERQIYTIKGFFGVLHNFLAQLGERARSVLRDLGAVKALQGQLNCTNTMVRTKAYINLAFLINEDENELINADDTNIKHIVTILENAAKSKNRFSKRFGFSARETIEALNKLAVNDGNKEKIRDAGALRFYEDLLLGDTVEADKEEIIHGLWILSFSPKCREDIVNMPDTMTCLRDLAKSENSKLRKHCNGVLWVLEEKGQKLEESDAESLTETGSEEGHIMISYNWGVKPLAIQLKHHLQQAGFKIWMDIDNMTGSTLEAMADAVEKASVVLICMTQKYKESPSCRTEAEYTYQLRKQFIPLRMEKGYKADGWLGIMIGSKLWFDFIKNFEGAAHGLVRELHQVGVHGSNPQKAFVKRETAGLTSSAPPAKPAYTKWTEREVSDWLAKIGLSNQTKKLAGLDGSLLLEYLTMKRDAPEFFYSSLRDDLRMSLLDILKFNKALNSL